MASTIVRRRMLDGVRRGRPWPVIVALGLMACGSTTPGQQGADAASGGQPSTTGGSAGGGAGGGLAGAGGQVGGAGAGGNGGALSDGGSADAKPGCSVTTKALGVKACTTPFLTWTGAELLALWPDSVNYTFRGQRLTADGAAVAPAWTSTIGPSWCHFGAAFTGDRIALLYVGANSTSTGFEQNLAALDANGATVLAPQSLLASPAAQNGECLRWNGTSYGGAWFASNDTTPRFAEISAAGVALFAPVTAPGPGKIVDLLPIAAGGWWWLVDNDGLASDLGVTRLAAAGAVTATQSTHITSPLTSARVVSSPAGTLIAYGDDDLENIHVRRLDEQTLTLGPDQVVGSDGYEAALTLVWNGQRFGLAWYGLDYSAGKTTIHLVELDGDGTPTAPPTTISSPDQGAEIAGGISRADWLAWAGDRWALAWLATRGVNDVMLSLATCP